jgi:VWFA-related protein
MSRIATRSLLLIALLPTAAGAFAAGAPQGNPPTISESVEVNLMVLDVAVVDAKGKPVAGLPASAFRVEVAKKPAEVAFVDEIARGTRPATPTPAELEKQTSGAAPPESDSQLTVPRYVSVFFDSRSMTPMSRNRAIAALRELTLAFSPDDQVQLLDFGSSLRVIRPWTTSKEALLAGLSDIADNDSGAARKVARVSSVENEIRMARRASRRQSIAASWAREVAIENRSLFDALQATLRDLDGQPGRRALLFVSDGFEGRPGEEMFELAVGRFGASSSMLPENSLTAAQDVARKANAAGVAIYSIEATGLRTSPTLDVGNATASGIDGESGYARRQNLVEGLELLASETGGAAVTGTNALGPGLGRIYDELSNFYQISVRLPAGAKVEELRDVEVRIADRKGLEVHAPRRWAGQAPDERLRRSIDAAFSIGRPFRDLTPKLEVSVAKEGGLFSDPELQVIVSLPTSEISLSGGKAKLTLYVEAIDDRGRRSDLTSTPWNATPGGPFAKVSFRTKCRSGNNRILVAIRDEATGKIGSAEYPINVE